MKITLNHDVYELNFSKKEDTFFLMGIFNEILDSIKDTNNEQFKSLLENYKKGKMPFTLKSELSFTIPKEEMDFLSSIGVESSFQLDYEEASKLQDISLFTIVKESQRVIKFFFNLILQLKNAEIAYLKKGF